MKDILLLFWRSGIAIFIKRLLLIYVALFVSRLVFYIYNYQTIGAIHLDELWVLFKGALQFDTISIIYVFGPFFLFSLLPFRFVEKRWWQSTLKGYFITISTLILAVNLADVVYFNYTNSRFTAGEIIIAGNDNAALLLGAFFVENWSLVLVWVVLVFFVWLGWRWCGIPKSLISNKYYYFGVHLIILSLVSVATIWAVRGCSLSPYTRPITLSNATSYATDVSKATMILSNPFCIFRTIGNNEIVDANYFTQEELDSLFTPEHYPATGFVSDKFGVAKGRNVMIFVLESFAEGLSAHISPDLYPDGKGFTPFLDSLMKDGFTMTNSYSNGAKSIEALPAILSSMPSFKTPFVLMPSSIGEGRQLPKWMKSSGYETLFFCGSPRGSMGFEAFATSVGFETLYSEVEFNASGREDAHDGYWGIWDEEFIDFAGEVLTSSKEPFMGTLFSVSSHHPFVIPERYEDVLLHGDFSLQRSASYTDMALRKFFEKYSAQEWFKNTLFVFVSDHSSTTQIHPRTKTSVGMQEIVALLYTSDGLLKGEYSEPFQQLDIMPTILGLMGNQEPYYAFGKDIFNEPERESFSVNYSGSLFQIIGDSLTVRYSDVEDEVVGAYLRDDILMKNNLKSDSTIGIERSEMKLKAVMQSYYNALKDRSYVVKTKATLPQHK